MPWLIFLGLEDMLLREATVARELIMLTVEANQDSVELGVRSIMFNLLAGKYGGKEKIDVE